MNIKIPANVKNPQKAIELLGGANEIVKVIYFFKQRNYHILILQ